MVIDEDKDNCNSLLSNPSNINNQDYSNVHNYWVRRKKNHNVVTYKVAHLWDYWYLLLLFVTKKRKHCTLIILQSLVDMIQLWMITNTLSEWILSSRSVRKGRQLEVSEALTSVYFDTDESISSGGGSCHGWSRETKSLQLSMLCYSLQLSVKSQTTSWLSHVNDNASLELSFIT